MARYFFHIFDGHQVVDAHGVELRTDRELRLHMLSIAATSIENSAQREYWHLEALDESGRVVGTMEFILRENAQTLSVTHNWQCAEAADQR